MISLIRSRDRDVISDNVDDNNISVSQKLKCIRVTEICGHCTMSDGFLCLNMEATSVLVAWHSGRTSFSDRRTFAVLRLICS